MRACRTSQHRTATLPQRTLPVHRIPQPHWTLAPHRTQMCRWRRRTSPRCEEWRSSAAAAYIFPSAKTTACQGPAVRCLQTPHQGLALSSSQLATSPRGSKQLQRLLPTKAASCSSNPQLMSCLAREGAWILKRTYCWVAGGTAWGRQAAQACRSAPCQLRRPGSGLRSRMLRCRTCLSACLPVQFWSSYSSQCNHSPDACPRLTYSGILFPG